ncbi:hypothetical protein CAPTEDRAFT_117513 [Capitella teleta]|uniref:Exoribonuclease phosphorolytic domain-containing protein n=1 Tax=Capitella teleta TaxID=283909 RepID=R7UIF9_CAPTE|nr:hypothetical protein CAPTEDRAFT_117513 [Capitella teleta]|eukprot:ELU03042.1 hypothetical protein CAPTEDRAFT_117513 [Capitella teleta]
MAGMEVRQLLSDRGFRVHGRKPNELRRIQCRMGVYSQTDGSAYIEQGNTKVLAAVHGLHEPATSSSILAFPSYISHQYSMAVFSAGDVGGRKKLIEMMLHLKQTIEASILTHLCPRSQIDISWR